MTHGSDGSDRQGQDEPPAVWPPYTDHPSWPTRTTRRRRAWWLVGLAVIVAAGLVGYQLVLSDASRGRGDISPAAAAPTSAATSAATSAQPVVPEFTSQVLGADRQFDANTQSSGAFVGEFMFGGMNAALKAQNHDAFFQYVQGDAVAPLELWWANMHALGATSGAIASGQLIYHYSENTADIQVRLGAVMPYAAVRPPDAPYDPGRVLVPFMLYDVSVAVYNDGAGGRMTTWAVHDIAAPWDSDLLYAAHGDGIVVAGLASEQALVESVLPVAEQATRDALSWYRASLGATPSGANGFVVFVSADQSVFSRWMARSEDPPNRTNLAGITSPGWRWPRSASDPAEADRTIAFRGSGLPIIALGPLAMDSSDEQHRVIVHEEMHALQMSDNPLDGPSSASTAAIEGWARYAEEIVADSAFAATWSDQQILRECVGRWFADEVPTTDQVYADDPEQMHCEYEISASMFAFAAEQGRNVLVAADDTYNGRVATPFANDAADIAAWSQWLRGR